jgi:hypothetical protein
MDGDVAVVSLAGGDNRLAARLGGPFFRPLLAVSKREEKREGQPQGAISHESDHNLQQKWRIIPEFPEPLHVGSFGSVVGGFGRAA